MEGKPHSIIHPRLIYLPKLRCIMYEARFFRARLLRRQMWSCCEENGETRRTLLKPTELQLRGSIDEVRSTAKLIKL